MKSSEAINTSLLQQVYIPPPPFPLSADQQKVFQKLLAYISVAKFQRCAAVFEPHGNGHIPPNFMKRWLQTAFAPPGDPHESYLIKDHNPMKIGRTIKFGYVCSCWGDRTQVCPNCARKQNEEREIRDKSW